MKKLIKKATIIKPFNGIDYYVATIIEEINDDSFSFVFKPHYEIIDLIPIKEFEGIQGIDLSQRKKEYVFNDYIPTFISERTFPQNRANVQELIKELNLEYYDPLEILLKSRSKYIGDTLKVIEYEDLKEISYSELQSYESGLTAKNIIKEIAKGNKIYLNDKKLENNILYEIVFPLYMQYLTKKRKIQLLGKETRIKNKSYKGRPRKQISQEEFNEIAKLYKNKEISVDKAISILNISRSTFFRKLSESQNF